MVLSAAAAGEAAYDDPARRHGLLTSEFLDALCTDGQQGRSAAALLWDVAAGVEARAALLGQMQSPVVSGEITAGYELPVLRRGPAWSAAFSPPTDLMVERSVDSLARNGVPPGVVAAWRNRFAQLNDLQIAAVNDHGLLRGRSLLVVAPTSSGKTFLGELAAIRAMEVGEKVVYLAPYKAIVTEKAEEFDALYSERLGYRVRRSSGDWRDDAQDIASHRFDLGVFTYESFLARALADPVLLDGIGTVVLDEAHFVMDPTRGIVVELLLAMIHRARARNPQLQLVLLSAVVGDTMGFEDWLECDILRTDSRPVPLTEGVLTPDGFWRYRNVDGAEGCERLVEGPLSGEPRAKASLVPLVTQRAGTKNEKVIVFRASRGEATGAARYLAREAGLHATDLADRVPARDGSSSTAALRTVLAGGTAFHTSDLSRDERRLVEEAFRDGKSGLQVLCATTTLAAGVNLPATTVVICETAFPGPAGQPFTVAQYKNMAGRAGRLGQAVEGRAILWAKNHGEADRLFHTYVRGEPEALGSSFSEDDLDTWLLRLLAQIRRLPKSEASNLIRDLFGSFLRGRSDPQWSLGLGPKVETSIDRLLDAGLLMQQDDDLEMTALGRACGAASFDLRSSLTLIDLLRSDDGWCDSAEKLSMLVQALPALDESYTPMHRHEPDRIPLLRRLIEVPFLLLQRGARELRSANARAKRGLVVHAWMRGMPIEEIERELSVHPTFGALRAGDIRGIADRTRFHLASAIDIAAVAMPERDRIPSTSDVILRRLELGLPDVGLAVADRHDTLSRGEILEVLERMAAGRTDEIDIVRTILAERQATAA